MAAIRGSWQQRTVLTATAITHVAFHRVGLRWRSTQPTKTYRPLSAKSRSAAPSRR